MNYTVYLVCFGGAFVAGFHIAKHIYFPKGVRRGLGMLPPGARNHKQRL